jgi:tRNA(fMet)-specific endonuclease VapC
MYLLDTNICIFAIKKKPAPVLDQIKNNMETGIRISTLTVAELEFGVSNSGSPERNRRALLEFLSIFELISFEDRDAIFYGEIRTKLQRKGNIIGPIDMLLSAQALSRNLTLVTNNVREFKRVEGLIVEDWSVE